MFADDPTSPRQDTPEKSGIVPDWSGEQLWIVVQSIVDYAIFVLDPERRVTLWNKGAELLFGYSEAEIIGQSGDILFTLEDRASGAPHKETDTARVNGVAGDQRWHLRKDGSRFFANGAVRPLWIGDRLHGFTKVCRDMTVRKKLDEELQRQARLLDLIHDPVFVWAYPGVIRYWNHAAEELYGYSLEEVVGRSPQELLLTEVPGGMPRLMKELEANGSWSGEVRHTSRDGRHLNIESRMVLLCQDEERLVLVSNRDITARSETDRALRESESRLQLAIAIAKMGMFEIDLLTDVTTVNEPGREIYGWPTNQLTFSKVQEQFHPEDREEILRRVGAAFDPAGPGEFEVEQRIIRTDGTLRWIRVRGRTRFEGEGASRRAVQCTGTYIDITNLKEAEAALRRADQRKDEFLAMLAHELRNPLAAVKNAVVLQQMSDGPENQVWAMEVIERQTAQLARLVDDLLDVSRITSGKIRLRKRLVDVAAVLDNAVEATRFQISERQHTLACTYEYGRMWAEADPARLEQIVVNLLTNAAKYTEAGGRIDLEAHPEGERAIVISVRDTGVGIPPEKLPEMFELFTQGERSIARSEGGLGIGLTIVKRLAEMHGGTIVAQSGGIGKGSVFTVRLPSAAPANPRTQKGKGAGQAAGVAHGTRILVVDDNHDMAAGMRRLLEKAGYVVQVAHDGSDALRIAHEFQPRVVLLDIGLPGMDGYSVAARLRAEEPARDILIIALTGYGQDEDRRRAFDAGIDHHFVKPVDFVELKRLIQERVAQMHSGDQ